jgi:hypothetical protein
MRSTSTATFINTSRRGRRGNRGGDPGAGEKEGRAIAENFEGQVKVTK